MSATNRPATLARRLERARRDQLGAERYRQRQRKLRRGSDRTGAARPLEHDANGFSARQRDSSIVKRVARLLDPR